MEKPTAGEERVKRVKHYSSAQSILLVGDGDFSFSLALATAFGSGANFVATSLDTYWALTIKYSQAESNIMELKTLGARVLHGVNVKTMKLHTDLKNRRFDRVIFNFRHAGFRGRETEVHVINSHKELVSAFFSNASHLLGRYGEIHISHKTGHPYDSWDLGRLASESSLLLIEKVGFQKEDYPGYNQKRGDGANELLARWLSRSVVAPPAFEPCWARVSYGFPQFYFRFWTTRGATIGLRRTRRL